MDLKQAYIEFIRTNGPYRFFFTVTFKTIQSRDDCIQQLNFMIVQLNRKIFGRYNKTEHVKGFVFTESQQLREYNPLHFHIVLKDNELFFVPGKKSLQLHFYDVVKKVGKQESPKKKTMSRNGCDFQDNIYDLNGLLIYLTKTYGRPVTLDQLQPIGFDGILPFDINYQSYR